MILELTSEEIRALKGVINHELLNYKVSRNQHIVPEYQDWYDNCERLSEVLERIKASEEEEGLQLSS